MAATLQQSEEPPRLSACLDAWASWSLPEPLRRRPGLRRLLGEGTGHRVFELDTEQPLVARVPRFSARLGLPADAEFAIQTTAALEGLAPRPFHLHEPTGIVIQERLERSRRSVSPAALGELILAIQRLPAFPVTLDLRACYQRYLDIARSLHHPTDDLMALDDPLLEEAFDFIDSLPRVPCHNDLTPTNLIMVGPRAVAVDWEYAGMGNACFELAAAADGLLVHQRSALFAVVKPPCVDLDCLKVSTVVYSIVARAWARAAGIDIPATRLGHSLSRELRALL